MCVLLISHMYKNLTSSSTNVKDPKKEVGMLMVLLEV